MITETETAFLAVVRAFLTEEKAALEELAALTCLLYTSPSPRDRG